MSVVFESLTYDVQRRLYLSRPLTSEQGYIAYVLPKKIQSSSITAEQALYKCKGTFVFVNQPLPVTTEEDTTKFMKMLLAILPIPPTRGFVWLRDPLAITASNVSYIQISASGRRIASACSISIYGRRWRLMLPEGLTLTFLNEQAIELTAERQTLLRFAGQQAPKVQSMQKAVIPLTGAQRGCIQIDPLYVDVRSLAGRHKLRTGFQFVYPAETDRTAFKSGWYPLLAQAGKDYVGFSSSFDPCGVTPTADPDKIRSFLRFKGHNADGSRSLLQTAFITKLGYPVQIMPTVGDEDTAMLVFYKTPGSGRSDSNFILSPSGKFVLSVQDGIGGNEHDLLCGISGTEYLTFHSGDFFHFAPYFPANARSYPFKPITATSYPADEIGSLLRPDYMTSYAKLTPMTDTTATAVIRYSTQAEDSVLYGIGRISEEFDKMFFDYKRVSLTQRADSPFFPMVPYGEVQEELESTSYTNKDYAEFERKVISPLRRHLLKADREGEFNALVAADYLDSEYQATTPAGQLVALNGSEYKKVLLGRSAKLDTPDLSFIRLTDELQKALQTNQMFMVATSCHYLGTSPADGIEPGFNNRLNIDDWEFSINTGVENSYMDYRDVILIKGRRDMSLRELVASPELWTQTNDFSVSALNWPSDQSLDASAELAGLSEWLKKYIDKGCSQPDEEFNHFRDIVSTTSWCGVLILKATLASLPDELGLLAAGMDSKNMFAHHLGAGSMQINKDLKPEENHQSAVFGLIHYVHPEYMSNDDGTHTTVEPDPGDYDFKVLMLKVTLSQGAVADFYCLSQLTVNKLFGQSVEGIEGLQEGNRTVLIEGNEERRNGLLTYQFCLKHDYVYQFRSSLLARVEFTGIILTNSKTSMNQEVSEVETAYQFNLSGYMAFHTVKTKVIKGQYQCFDVMSFGEPEEGVGGEGRIVDPEAAKRIGLCFSALPLTMYVPASAEKFAARRFELDPTRIIFDTDVSTVRKNSLFRSFPLELIGLIEGKGDIETLGYIPVGVVPEMTGIDSGGWHGLHYRLNLGDLGSLAGNEGIAAELLLAWSPDDGNDNRSYHLSVGFKMPSILKRFQIQGVMELLFEHLFLRFDPKFGFSLEMNPVVLRLLGLKQLPTGGAMSMKLFGKDGEKQVGWYGIYNEGS